MENNKNTFTVRCPCCGDTISITLASDKNTSFFNTQNPKDIIDKLSTLGYEFGEMEVQKNE